MPVLGVASSLFGHLPADAADAADAQLTQLTQLDAADAADATADTADAAGAVVPGGTRRSKGIHTVPPREKITVKSTSPKHGEPMLAIAGCLEGPSCDDIQRLAHRSADGRIVGRGRGVWQAGTIILGTIQRVAHHRLATVVGC